MEIVGGMGVIVYRWACAYWWVFNWVGLLGGENMWKVILVIMMLMCSVCSAETWEWQKKDNPEYVACVDIYEWAWSSYYSTYEGTEENIRKEGLKIDVIEQGIELYGFYKNIDDEILAYRSEKFWGENPFSYDDTIYFVKIRKKNKEIITGYLRETVFISTRKKLKGKDIGGYISDRERKGTWWIF